MAPPCTICNSTDTKYCTQCHSTSYCSPKCQKVDWPCHKLLCPHYTANTERPSPQHKRAILFSPDVPAPAFVWIKCDEKLLDPDEPSGSVFEIPQINNLLGVTRIQELYREEFQKNFVRGRELQYPFEFWMRDNFLNDGSRKCQSAHAATKGNMAHDWRGPLVALKYTGPGGGHGGRMDGDAKYADMDMQDFRDAVDFLTYYTNEEVWSKYWTAGGPRPAVAKPGEKPARLSVSREPPRQYGL